MKLPLFQRCASTLLACLPALYFSQPANAQQSGPEAVIEAPTQSAIEASEETAMQPDIAPLALPTADKAEPVDGLSGAANTDSDPMPQDQTPLLPQTAAGPLPTDGAPLPGPLPSTTDGPASAEAPPAAVGQILQRVFATHPQVRQALGEVESTHYAIESARAGYYPYVQLQSAVTNKSRDGNSTISIVQPLWDGGLTGAQLKEAKQRREAAFAALTQVRLNLSQEAIASIFDILGADAQLKLWDQYIASLQKSRATIENRARNGAAPESDVQTIFVRISLAESGREVARTQRFTARSRLSSLMSEPPPPLEWPNDASRLTAEDLPGLLDRVEQHPSMTVDRQSIDIQKAIVEGAKSSLWPQLSLQHRQQLSGDRFDPSSDATLLVMQYQTTNGVRAYQRGQSEQARVGAAEQKLAATRANLQAQFRSDTAQLLAYATQIGSQSRAAAAATNLVESYQRQFDAGRKTWIELLNAIREAHEARIQAANTQRAYWQTNIRLVLQATLWGRLGLEAYLDPLKAVEVAKPDSGRSLLSRLGFEGPLNADAPVPAGTVEGK